MRPRRIYTQDDRRTTAGVKFKAYFLWNYERSKRTGNQEADLYIKFPAANLATIPAAKSAKSKTNPTTANPTNSTKAKKAKKPRKVHAQVQLWPCRYSLQKNDILFTIAGIEFSIWAKIMGEWQTPTYVPRQSEHEINADLAEVELISAMTKLEQFVQTKH